MKSIPLTNGGEALVDDCDYIYLMQWKWYTKRHQHSQMLYAIRTSACGGRMHRLIASRAPHLHGKKIDHVDGNGLNNQRHNLRVATASQNGANRGPTRQNTSGFKGVSWHKSSGKWGARIVVKQRQIWLGLYADKFDAARAYNKAALEHFGEYAVLNKL